MRRLHPLAAVFRTLNYAVAGAGVPLFLSGMASTVLGPGRVFETVPVVALAGVGLLVGVGYGLAWYLRFTYEVTADTFDVSSGVVSRREREIPLDRVQNVDVEASAWQQLLGLAVVRVETAGGGGTEATLDFVSAADAERLRRDLRDRRRSAPAAESEATETARADPEQSLLFSLTTRELAVYSLTEFRPAALVLSVLGAPLLGDAVVGLVLSLAAPLGGPERFVLRTLTPDQALAVAAVALPLTVAGAWVVGAALALNDYSSFTIVRRGEDLAYERGLLTKYSGTIPLAKVQTVTLRENVLQRALGYAGLSVDTAGYGGESDGGRRSAVPMAARDRALALVSVLEDADADAEFTRPPTRARRRYAVRYALGVLTLTAGAFAVSRVVEGFSLWWTPAALLVLVPAAAHLTWRHRGYALGPDHLLVRSGFWRRRTTVVPYYRLQTVARSRTVFQRRRDLASVLVDTASGAVLGGGGAVVYDLAGDDARGLATRLREALQASRRG